MATSHKTSPLEEILIEEPFCKQHNERLTLFCKQHDSPCCRTCSSQNHKQCKDHISKIDDIVRNMNMSNGFHDTEQDLDETSENIKKFQEDSKQNLVSLKNSKIEVEKEVEKEIKELRVQLNNHLDKLQEDIIKELSKSEETERGKIQKIADDLKQWEKDVYEMHVNLSNIQQHASNSQAFLAMRQIQKNVTQIDRAITLLGDNRDLRHKKLVLEINEAINGFLSSTHTFGKIVVETKDCSVVITKKKNEQAFVPLQHIKDINDITLQKQHTLDVNSREITGCCTLPDGRFVFTYCREKTLILIKSDGTHDTTLTTPSNAFDVTYVEYNSSLAITSGYSNDSSDQCITFLNIEGNTAPETISLDSNCYGMAEKDDTLFFCTDDSIISMNLKDKSISKFKDFKRTSYTYIDIYKNNLYHTNYEASTITCYDLSGEVKWEFEDENIIHVPRGISVDNEGNVYVAGGQTANVVVISSDGQECKKLLTTKDGLDQPTAIRYVKSTDNLLVTNMVKGKAFIYEVT